MLTNAYADQVAGHGEVAVFRAKKQAEINAKKVQLKTQLNVVGALGVLDDELLARQLDAVTFSKLVLGMMMGNGYRDGVTSGLKASAAERLVIERIVKKAASHMNGPNFAQNQIWAAQGNPAMQMQHLNVLNKWITEAAKAAPPCFNHDPHVAAPYQPLDQIITAICQSFNGGPSQAMIQHAQQLSQDLGPDYSWPIKQFIVRFSTLTAAEQAEIVLAYNAYVITLGDDQIALSVLANECDTPHHARNFIQIKIEERTMGPFRGFIDAIPGGLIQNLSPAGSTLAQRNAIRTVLVAMEPLTSAQKEMCLEALFSRKLNQLIPVAAKAVQENIRILIEQIVLNPAIVGRVAITKALQPGAMAAAQNVQLKTCLDAIARLPDVARDIHYKALIERIRQMRPAINPNPGGATKEALQQAFLQTHTQLLNELIRNRVAAITPPKELISPAPRMPDPNGAVDAADHQAAPYNHAVTAPDYAENLGAIFDVNDDIRNAPFNSGLPHHDNPNGRLLKSEYDFESRLIHFLINHWAAYYKPEIPDDINTEPLKQALQAKFNAINITAGINIVEKKRRKIVLIESILYRLIAYVQQPLPDGLPQPPGWENALNDMGIPMAQMNSPENRDLVNAIRQQVDEAKQQRQAILTPLLINPMLAIINADPVPENHVYTSMAAIKALPSINWDEELNTHVYSNPVLRQQPGETDIVYWRRIGNYLIGIYNRKIKPHLYPDGLQATLDRNEAPQLVPFAMMFSDAADASNAINYPAADHGAQAQQQVLEFDITPRNLQLNAPVGIKQKLHDSYKKTHDFAMNSIQKLFCLPILDGLPDPLPWPFFSHPEADRLRENIEEFTQERKELCKKLLLALSYFDRAGDHFEDDMPMLASLIGRFTHCADGKKGAIESVARLALKGLRSAIVAVAADGGAAEEGEAGLELGEADFDTLLKQIILVDFKNDTITAVADHNHHESVSIITNIKFRHKDFWNVPTNSEAQYPNYTATDYAFKQAGHEAVDIILRYFYQHIYVGPHELVNKIHAYLRSVDAHKRENFLGLVCTMLGRHHPFADWTEDGIDYRNLVKQRYCEVLNQAEVGAAIQAARAQAQATGDDQDEAEEEAIANTADYIFTRKGIETILFYAGYLAWNGLPGAHPLRADWNANLAWLRANDVAKYNAIYTH